MKDYIIKRITSKVAKEYIHKNHYSHGSHANPSPCYGLFDEDSLVGVCMFAVPCSENVRSSIFGKEKKSSVLELHRLHLLDCTPSFAESWFVSRCFKLLKQEYPEICAIISFADSTEGHTGIIYKALNAYRCGMTPARNFYVDETGRLRHPRQNGQNISLEDAKKLGWSVSKRLGKFRFLWLLPKNKTDKRFLLSFAKAFFDKHGVII